MSIGLLTGKVRINAEARLQSNCNKESDSDEEREENGEEKVIKNITNLVQLAADTNAFDNMRLNSDNQEVFGTFVNYCLVHLTSSVNWRCKAYNTCISDIFTETDEALAMLLLENNIDDFNKVISLNRKLIRNESRPKYTKVHCEKEKFRGWHRNGIKRFNYLVTCVKKGRACNDSKDMEVKLKSNYAKLCGKLSGININGDGNSSDSDDSDDGDLEAYDGFAGESNTMDNEDESNTNRNGNRNGIVLVAV